MTEQHDGGAWIFENGSKVVFDVPNNTMIFASLSEIASSELSPSSEPNAKGLHGIIETIADYDEAINDPGCAHGQALRRHTEWISRMAQRHRHELLGSDLVERLVHQSRPQSLEGTWKPITSSRPMLCQGCANYYGKTDGGNRLICAIHPSGVEGDTCLDWVEG